MQDASISPIGAFDCGCGLKGSPVDLLGGQAAEFLGSVFRGVYRKGCILLVSGEEQRGYSESAREEAKDQPREELPPHTRHPTITTTGAWNVQARNNFNSTASGSPLGSSEVDPVCGERANRKMATLCARITFY